MRKLRNLDTRPVIKGIIIALTLLLILLILHTVVTIHSSLRGYHSYSISETEYETLLYHQDYDELLRDVSYYLYGTNLSNKEKEIKAAALYYDAAMQAHAFEVSGNTEEEEGQKTRMENYRKQMGSLSGEADRIDRYVQTLSVEGDAADTASDTESAAASDAESD